MDNQKQKIEKTVAQMAEQKFGKEKLAELQAQYPGRKLNILVVEDKVAVLMPLTPKALSNYTRMIMNQDAGIDDAARMLIDELWLGGDTIIRDDEEYFMSAMIEIQKIIELKKSASGKY